MSRLTMVKNAFANLCRGGAAALVTLLLPPFLTRILSKDAYGTWLFILQISTYVSFIDFGIQTAVGRYIAHHNELKEFKERDSIVSTSLAILSVLGAVAMLGMGILVWQLTHLFKDIPAELHQDARLALLCVGGSLAIALPFNVFGAIFIGLQRYDIPAWIIGSGKLLGGLFVVLVANASGNIFMMGLVMGLSNLLTGLWLYFAYRKIVKDIKLSTQKVSTKSIAEIINYCSGILVWNIGMILVSGLDTAIIGYFDFRSVVYYTLAAGVTNFITGTQSSIFSTLLPNAAAISARGDREALGRMLVTSTRYAAITLISTSLPIILFGDWLLQIWVGQSYVANTAPILQLLIIANFIRQLGAPYAIIAMAMGDQRLILLSPLIEGLVNLVASIILVKTMGVVGVAIGTIVGGVISVLLHLFYNLPRTKNIKIKNQISTLALAVAKPSISVFPTIILFTMYLSGMIKKMNPFDSIATATFTLLSSLLLVFFMGLSKDERGIFNKIVTKKIQGC